MRAPTLTQKRARALRRALSLPEVLLWPRLRDRRTGMAFRRQHPVGRYVLDFYCARARLAVEIDGQSHWHGEQPQRDLTRDAWLGDQGIEVLRLPAADVLADLDQAADLIWREAAGRLPMLAPSTASRSPSPSPSMRGRI